METNPVLPTQVIAALASVDISAAWSTMVGATNVGSAGAFLPDRGGDLIFYGGFHPSIVGVGMSMGVG